MKLDFPEKTLTEVGEGHTFVWKNFPEGALWLHGVGFAVRSELLRKIREHPTALTGGLQQLSEHMHLLWKLMMQQRMLFMSH